MGDGSRGEKRRARARAETAELLQPLLKHIVPVSGVVQCGLGDWAEGPVLNEFFNNDQEFMAVEPIQRYCFEAWRDGFRGPIIQAALWNCTGKRINLQDFRSRTSMLDKESRRGEFPSTTLTLDDALEYVQFEPEAKWLMMYGQASSLLLWMDC